MFRFLKVIRKCCCILIYLVFFDPITAFNIDLTTPIVYYGSNESMFGFTVAPYKLNGKSWVLIGAPKHRDEYFSQIDSNYTGGSVFKCTANENSQKNQCTAIKFPTEKPNSIQYHIERQGLGASLATSGSDGAVVVCAPRIYIIVEYKSGLYADETYPIGICYYSKKDLINFMEHGKLYPSNEYQGQTGFSVSVSKDSQTVYAGAVSGSLNGRTNEYYGYISSFNMDNKKNEKKRDNIMKPTKLTPQTYFGYSITSLDFHNTPITGVAVASPKAEQFRGKVNIFTSNFTNSKSKELKGEQFAAYFGYSICTSDVDGDGADDLIIGAPFYSTDVSLSNQFYENGRIYVYYQGNNLCPQKSSICWDNIFKKFDTIDGEHSKGRFGFAIASIGDINQDGFGDIAVGAPYEEFMKHTGAVYIYHGSKGGIVKHASQIIRASEVYNLNQMQTHLLNSFGSSLSGGLDLDGNSYPDLVVGAHESDVAFLFRSRPIINLIANISFSKSVIELDEKSCKLKDGTKVPCVQLEVCLLFKDSAAENEVEISTEIILDYEQPASRMFFFDNEKNYKTRFSMVLQKNKRSCKQMTTYVANLRQDEDKLSQIRAHLVCSLIVPKIENKNGALNAVLNSETTSVIRKSTLFIKNNCGEDNICIPDLRIFMKSNHEKFVLDPKSSQILHFNVSVINKGEDSYRSVFYLKLPQGLNFSHSTPISCPTPNSDNNFTIICEIGSPIPKDKTVNFTIVFEVTNCTNLKEDTFTFLANVNSTNLNLNKNPQSDNEKSFNISIVETPNLSIAGSSSPKEIFNFSTNYNLDAIETDTQTGPVLLHQYFIENSGFLEISEAVAKFYWPQKLNTGENLLYLISQPITEGPIKCDHIDNLNYEKLKLDNSYDHLLKPNNDREKNDTSKEGSNRVIAQRSVLTATLIRNTSKNETRKIRQVDSKVTNDISCLLGKCITVQCKIEHLRKNQVASIAFSSVVWAKTFQDHFNKTVQISSYVQINVTKQAHRNLPSNVMLAPKQIFTNITVLKIENGSSEGSLSYNIESVFIGILILTVIIYVLYKLQFFKRNRPSNSLEENLVPENGQELDDNL